MIKLKINSYKSSGKWYGEQIIELEKDIPIWDDKFKKMLTNNISCACYDGFIVVDDMEDNQTFHKVLYPAYDIIM